MSTSPSPRPGDLDFRGQCALVVGGSSGIGNGIAQAFRERGAQVHVWGTRAASTDYTADEGSDLEGLGYSRVDVSDPAQIASAPAPFQRLDVLVLCQGTVAYSGKEFRPEEFQRVVALNLNSVMNCCARFADLLEEARGAVITVSSIAGFRATRGNPAYSASKSGLVGLTQTLGEAWCSRGIRVNGIAPGFVDTKLTKVTTDHPERLAKTLAAIPLGRLGTSQDMAGAALFLASPLASYIVGQTILVDGGITLS